MDGHLFNWVSGNCKQTAVKKEGCEIIGWFYVKLNLGLFACRFWVINFPSNQMKISENFAKNW